MIPQAFIQDLLDRVDIVDVVGRVVKLRKAGANMIGLCPFHNEKSPSFTVSPSKQFYHCFGCQANGSAIGFLMAHAGLGYVEAINELAQGLGLVVPNDSAAAASRPAVSPQLVDRLAQAASFYQRRLREAPQAIAYLKGRGLSGRTAARFGLGYAPPGWRNLDGIGADYDDRSWEEVGLVKQADPDPGAPQGASGGRRRYDRFRDRIMFPIRNPRGLVIGFGGRVLHKGEPKYLNSPETVLFQKGRELYGLFEARERLRELDLAIVVEGYMDVVMLAEHGIDNAVATLGTATTGDHVRKLLRVVDRLVFSFDGDPAGRKAAWRALLASLPIVGDSQALSFLFLPDGADPDSFVREHGAPAWQEALGQAMPLSAFMMQGLVEGLDMATPEGRAAFLAAARPLLHSLGAQGLRLQLMHQTADLARIGMVELERFMAAEMPPAASPKLASPATPGPRAASGSDEPGQRPAARSARHPAPRQTSRRPLSAATRAGRPSLERRLRLLSICHPVLCQAVRTTIDPACCPVSVLDWFDALAALPETSSSIGALEALRARGGFDLTEVEADLATQWSGIPGLSLDEARAEFDGALRQLERRAEGQAAREMIEQGLQTDDERRIYRELLASRR